VTNQNPNPKSVAVPGYLSGVIGFHGTSEGYVFEPSTLQTMKSNTYIVKSCQNLDPVALL